MHAGETTRRELFQNSAALGLAAAAATAAPAIAQSVSGTAPGATELRTLPIPANGIIPVAVPISEGAVVIDFTGPWEVFLNGTMRESMSGKGGFMPYIVAEKSEPVETSGGMKTMPNHTFDNAPPPKVIVIPAQTGDTPATIQWIREASKAADMTMSVCTGAFVLAKTGLLSGKSATTHHSAYAELAMQYPDIRVKRGYRFVDEGNVASSGGLSCGIDLAFHVVERYFGRDRATQTAFDMEYQGKGWMDASGADNAIYALARGSLVCPLCGMAVDAKTSPASSYKGHTYYFCSTNHKALFDAAPEKVLQMAAMNP